MRHRPFALAIMLSLLLFLAACQRNNSQSPNTSERTLSMTATASPSQDVVNAVFVVTPDQVRKAFDEAELRGEKLQGISVGEEKSINISAQDPLGGTETLKFSILFLAPLEQARTDGYRFGLVAKQRTPEDRKDFEDTSISTITKKSNEVTFRVFLQQPKSDDATIPSIKFKLLDKNGNRIDPLTQPDSYVASVKDLIGAVALAEDGQPVTFPLFAESSPHLSNKMQKMTLIVDIDGKELSLEYALK